MATDLSGIHYALYSGRQSGKTTALAKAAKEIGATIVCGSLQRARVVAEQHGVPTVSINALVERPPTDDKPVLFDNDSLEALCSMFARDLAALQKSCNDQAKEIRELKGMCSSYQKDVERLRTEKRVVASKLRSYKHLAESITAQFRSFYKDMKARGYSDGSNETD